MANTKTPVMALHELSVKKGWISPEYNITHSKQGTHINEFHYEVKVESVVGYGVGRSKKIAKHEAAQSVLDSLMKLNLYSPDGTIIKAPCSPIKLLVNAIGDLNEICVENKIPLPTYTEISDIGPPHCKEFTYDCQLASIATRATGGSKKQAKQLAAKEMLDRLIQALPSLIQECYGCEVTEPAITEQDQKASESYVKIKKLTQPKKNKPIKYKDYDKHLINMIKERGLNPEDLREYLKRAPTEENLKMFLAQLELDYVINTLNETPYIVALSINTVVSFTVIAMGTSFSNAVTAVLVDTFKNLDILLW